MDRVGACRNAKVSLATGIPAGGKRSKKIHDKTNGSVRAAKPTAKDGDHEVHVLACAASDRKKRGAKDPRKTFKDKLRREGLLDEVHI